MGGTRVKMFGIKYRKLLEQNEKLEKENQDLTTDIKCLKAKNKTLS